MMRRKASWLCMMPLITSFVDAISFPRKVQEFLSCHLSPSKPSIVGDANGAINGAANLVYFIFVSLTVHFSPKKKHGIEMLDDKYLCAEQEIAAKYMLASWSISSF